ncbi:hypothetical protein SDRG_17040 [Saprolegnia diclina VS20]|uniref:Uncharacterized protein n=1 Tax=Saprolegnia diclina (strain VS20) TaxID=1156394 RepID=T0R6D6_SAPDV|nr:hypothetical protein SDRG_17040 [Saprolegnia diclina VS20]EQC25077.1 hypothetical protein SDRG_17040 [Saprolegnia diclina VS20]|eukprot:XP_008621494.1 hypothetical protein SDRG_17040 [Saprolegnia diclina VS20]
MTGIACLVLLAATVSTRRIHDLDLLSYHRVASATWVGRPLLFLRGATALIVLGTAPLSFVSTNGISHFVSTPRSMLDVMVLAGEANWVSYVLVDFLLPLLGRRARWYAPLGAAISWLATILLEICWPFEAIVTVQQSCTVVMLGLDARCSGGSVQIGSLHRLYLICSLQFASLALAALIVRLWLMTNEVRDRGSDLLPASAQVFLSASQRPTWFRDPTTTLMAGILPFGRRHFHVNLWQFVRPSLWPSLGTHATGPETPSLSKAWHVKPRTLLGIVYVLSTVIGSLFYIYVSTDAMTNDFWWASFNTSGHGTFLATLFTQQLQTTFSIPHLDLTRLDWSDNSNRYNTSATSFSVPMLYASMVQNEVNTLQAVIDGLRRMDGCLLPWIATTYCYVDLNRTWELAVSSYRQSVCDMANGAVYLEPILRNGNQGDLEKCWGASLTIGVFDYLETTQYGQMWRQSLRRPPLSIADEAIYWQTHGLRFYETQWQNYKSLGVIETYSVANALGFAYPLTIKSSNGSLHTTQQTSFKMQWPLASLLWAITVNSSGLSGSSLVRQSPRFAFANRTIASVLARNGSLTYPLDIAFDIVERTLGPFGTISMRRVAYPDVLVNWSRSLTARFSADMVLASGEFASAFESIGGGLIDLSMAPAAWGVNGHVGGDLLCPTQPPSESVCMFYTNQGACSVNMEDTLSVDAVMGCIALLAVGPDVNVTRSCDEMTLAASTPCRTFLEATTVCPSY